MEKDAPYYVDLIIRYLAGEASEDEIRELSSWIKADPDHALLFREHRATWIALEKSRLDESIDIDRAWSDIESRLISPLSETRRNFRIVPVHAEKPSIRSGLPFLLRIAAIMVIFAIPVYLLFRFVVKPDVIQLTAQADLVESKLPDGSSVTLNSGSTLEYPVAFNGDKRQVSLTGEAYFEVTHDKTKPFIISSGDVRIKVLGTSFYVNTNTSGEKMEIVLTTGRVLISFDDGQTESRYLSPGEKAEVTTSRKNISITVNSDPNYLAWKTHRMVFADNDLGQVVAILNKTYHSNIRVAPGKLAQCRITATFDKQSLESVLRVLKATLDIEILKTASGIEISGNGCE